MQFEFCIVGSGFSGSLLAWILARTGRSVCIIDRGQHPRFAIGESSTPLADMLLQQIAAEFDLPELSPLSRWGTWQTALPGLRAGKKRGFSYFSHSPDQPFSESSQHESSLLVAASDNDTSSDTHWMRSDVDHWFWHRAGEAGAQRVENVAEVSILQIENVWHITGSVDQEPIEMHCRFVIDSTGGGGLLAQALQLKRLDARLRTTNGAIFGHFRNVGSMSHWMQANDLVTGDDPFNSDDAAQHHLLAHGRWIWMLRFSEGTTSVGIVQPTSDWPAHLSSVYATTAWKAIVGRYPTVNDLMRRAQLVGPIAGYDEPRLGWLPKISRLWSAAAGERWAMLPNTVGVVDPLHSTGIAHALSGVQRLARILLGDPRKTREALQHYSTDVVEEVLWIDRIVATCYVAARQSFEHFAAACSLYFVAAIHSERALHANVHYERPQNPATLFTKHEYMFAGGNDGFLLKNNRELQRIVDATERQTLADARAFKLWLGEALKPWNDVGLMDDQLFNRIARSTAEKLP